MPDCPNCGSKVPGASKFCPECGRALTDSGGTAVRPRRRRWPPDPLLVVVGALAVGALVLLVAGEWAWGVVALLGAGLVFLSQREAERRAARYALAGFGARFAATREAFAARSRGQLDLFRSRRERAELEAERTKTLRELGHAVYYEDKEGIKSAKAAVVAVADRIEAKEAEIDTLIRQIDERVQRAQSGFRPTEKLEQPPGPRACPSRGRPRTRAPRPSPPRVLSPSRSRPPPSRRPSRNIPPCR